MQANLNLKWKADVLMRQTFAVFRTTFLQSGKMLTDHAGKWYELPLKLTVASDLVSTLARKAAHTPDPVLYTAAWEKKGNTLMN